MKIKIFVSALISIVLCSCSNGQQEPAVDAPAGLLSTPAKNITIANWNIEWLGSEKQGPYDKDLQQENAYKIMHYLNAQLYGICEVVDIQRLKAICASLGANYTFTVSDYCTDSRTADGQAYDRGQKMAFVYDKNIFSHVRTRGFMRSSRKAYYNFSNGRFPFLLQADVLLNGNKIAMSFLLLHAKSGADQTGYRRRMAAATEMKDSIARYLNGMPLLLMGDFNDMLGNTITKEAGSSPYAVLLQNDFLKALTYTAEQKHETSTLHYRNVIDHQLVNSRMLPYVVPGSTSIRADIVNAVRDYKKGNTSDHYPVTSILSALQNGTTTSNTVTKVSVPASKNETTAMARALQSSVTSYVALEIQQDLSDIAIQMKDASGKTVISFRKKYLAQGQTFRVQCREIPAGTYTLVLSANGDSQSFKIEKR